MTRSVFQTNLRGFHPICWIWFCLLRLQAQCSDESEARALRLTLKNLIVPEQGMGETFKVLVQGKGVGQPELLCARQISAIPFAGL